jgi:magnesium transporter
LKLVDTFEKYTNMNATEFESFANQLALMPPDQAAKELDANSEAEAASILAMLSPAVAEDVMLAMSDERRRAVFAAAPTFNSQQWTANLTYDADAVGRLMEHPHAVFRPNYTVTETIERIRKLAKNTLVTYGFIVDDQGVLLGIVAMRELLLAENSSTLNSVMLKKPFVLAPTQKVIEAMRLVVNLHFPIYPVCDETGRLVGTVRGRSLFEQQAYEISAQAGSMVGVEKEERIGTPWPKSLRFRHPWLQINLFTAFLAAAVVGCFQSIINEIVLLAVFLPVISGQSQNTGCQSLAIALRGLTLGELLPGSERRLVFKEGMLGLMNGALVGVTASLAMFGVAWFQSNEHPYLLAFVVFWAMIGSCILSGITGAFIPVLLRRLGTDPANASSIFLTTITDVGSMGLFLGLAKMFVG